MARKFMNKANQSGTTIMDNVKDGIQRLVPDWMGRKDGTYNTEQNHIVFDFETVHNGRRTQTYTPSDGSTITYGWDDWHNPDIVTDAMKAEKKPKGKPRFPEPEKYEQRPSNQNQEPFEMGLSVRDKTGKWRHKSFMFTPQGINERFSSGKRFEKRSISFHNMSAGFHLHPEKGTASGSPSRATQIREHVENYTMGKGENIPVDWGAIEKWLTGHGVSLDKKTNFIAHNGVFDYPLLERLFTETDADAGTSFLSKLYIDSVDLHGSFPGIKNGEWQREALWNDSKGQTFHNGAYGAEFPSIKVQYNYNKRYEIPSNDPDKGAVEKFRRKGDGAHGANFQDSMLELSRLLGSSGNLDEDDGRIVLRKAQGSGKYNKDLGYYPIAYSHLREWEGRGGPLAGTSMDNFREVIGSNAFTEGADNHASRLFQQIADDLNANKNNDFLSDLGLMDSVRALIGEGKDAKPVDCYNAFNDVAGHSGAGDTAFMTEIFFPFMADVMDLFDHTKWSKPELTYLEGGSQRPVEQVRDFKESISEFQERWGSPLGNVPPKPESGERSKLADPIVETGGVYKNKFIQRVVDQLGDPTAWEDDEGNEINPLVARWKKEKATEGGEQLHLDNAESHAEPGSENEHNPDDSPEDKSNSEGLNILNQAIENSRSKGESYSVHWDGGPITFAKWKGYIHSGRDTDEIEPLNRDLIIASVPIGNARVAFRESRREDANGKITSQFKPFLGITTLVDENDILTTQAISDYAEELLGSSARVPTGQLIGTEISGLLEENLQGIRNHLGGHYSLDHEKLNTFINTPASAWLSEGLKPGTPLTVAAILKKAGVENREEYRQLLQTIWQNYLGEDGIEDHDNTIFSNILSASTPHLAGFLEESNEWLDPSLLKGLEGFTATEISGDELFQTNPEDPTQIGVNLQRLAQLFSSGHEIDGIHPQQFLYDHPDDMTDSGWWEFDPANAFIRFMKFMQQVNDGADPVNLLISTDADGKPLFYPDAAPIHNLKEPISQTTDDTTFNNTESSAGDRTEAANNSVENAGADEGDPKTKAADAAVRANAEARAEYEDLARKARTKAELDAKVAARIKALKLDASPFITQNYIETVQAQESLGAAYDSLFPPRETAETLDEVYDLLDNAVARHGRDGEKPDATSLVRELEWIRRNHPSIFSQQEMATALQTNDFGSVQGQYLDLMNTAYKAMGDSAGESLSLIQDEQIHMGDRFMGNAHRQFLHAKHVGGLQSNWYDVDDPTTVQEHFAPEPEPEQESRSFRDIARDMAVATAKAPLEALKYYTNWNALSQQYKDVSSGRTEAGEKLLDAVRGGEKFREVNIGTPEEPQYARTEEEYNYYIENIPVGGEAQPSILRQFLQGKKTYGDIADEQEESQAGVISRIRSVFPEQRKWEQQQIAERSTFATTPITPEQEERGAESGASGRRAQGTYASEVTERLEQIRGEGSEPGYKQEGGLFVPKSLDKLREYLLRV